MLLSYLRDLIKHTARLGFNAIELNGENGEVTIEGTDENNKTLVLKGKFLKPLPELDGRSGLGSVDILANYVNAYSHKDDTLTIKRKDATFKSEVRDDDGNMIMDDTGEPSMETVTKNIVEEFVFERGTQMKNHYRLMNIQILADQPKFPGLPWCVEIEPSNSSIELLTAQTGFGAETDFGVSVEDKTMYFTFGKTAVVEFAYDVEGEITKSWTWDAKKVLDVLKLSNGSVCTMRFSDKGALQITLNTGLAEYNYIIPAKS